MFIQTYNPEHYSIVYAAQNNYTAFYNDEIIFRRQLNYPPFTNMFVVLMTGLNEDEIKDLMGYLYDILNFYNTKRNVGIVYSPVPAVISKINNKYRYRIIIKCNDEDKLKRFVLFCVDKLKENRKTDNVSLSLTLNPEFTF